MSADKDAKKSPRKRRRSTKGSSSRTITEGTPSNRKRRPSSSEDNSNRKKRRSPDSAEVNQRPKRAHGVVHHQKRSRGRTPKQVGVDSHLPLSLRSPCGNVFKSGLTYQTNLKL